MLIFRKISILENSIKVLCKKHGHTLLGEIKKPSDDKNWTFAVKTASKTFLVRLIVPYGLKDSCVTFISDSLYKLNANVLGFKGLGGSWGFPLQKEVELKLSDEAFGLATKDCEKIYLIYPACSRCAVKVGERYVNFNPDMDLRGIKLHDGASFRYLLENSDEKTKYKTFDELCD